MSAAYPESYYAATTALPEPRPHLVGSVDADVCVIGAGFTGLSAALTLAGAGLKVVVLEAVRVGWGASGRNGGQIASGQAHSPMWLEAKLGERRSERIWRISEDAKSRQQQIIDNWAPDANYTAGNLWCLRNAQEMKAAKALAEFLQTRYGYNRIELLDGPSMRQSLGSEAYIGGYLDHGAGHVHPLRLCLGYARAAKLAGVHIFEHSPVRSITAGQMCAITTDFGELHCKHYVLAGNGYCAGLSNQYDSYVAPVASFIIATEPLPSAVASSLLTHRACGWDDSPLVNYFRLSSDNRMLFGGRSEIRANAVEKMRGHLYARMTKMFPQLQGIGIDYAWGGYLGVTRSYLPFVQQLDAQGFCAGGYTGNGVLMSGAAGHAIAQAILGNRSEFDDLAALPVPRFPVKGVLREFAMRGVISYRGLRDRFGL